MDTKLQDFFYAGYKAIEKDIGNGCNSEALLLKFQNQTKFLKKNEIIDYIRYIKSKQYTGSVWNNGHQILSSLKTELNLIEELHKLSTTPQFPHELKTDKARELFNKSFKKESVNFGTKKSIPTDNLVRILGLLTSLVL